jgi:AcrR family transcriptional regulator
MLDVLPQFDGNVGDKPGRRMRSRLLDAAAARFKAGGFSGVSVAEIAADAGAFPSQVTYYFGTKEALFVEAACREMLYVARDAEAASVQHDLGEAYVETMVRSVVGMPGLNLFVEALALAHRRRDLHPLVRRTFERLDAESGRAWAEHCARRGWSTGANPFPAHRFWVIAIGMAARSGATGEPIEALTGEMLALLCDRGVRRETGT